MTVARTLTQQSLSILLLTWHNIRRLNAWNTNFCSGPQINHPTDVLLNSPDRSSAIQSHSSFKPVTSFTLGPTLHLFRNITPSQLRGTQVKIRKATKLTDFTSDEFSQYSGSHYPPTIFCSPSLKVFIKAVAPKMKSIEERIDIYAGLTIV